MSTIVLILIYSKEIAMIINRNSELEKNMYAKYMKRLLDILLSLTILVVLSPLLLVLCILVRSKLGSPIFFKQ